MSWQAIATAPKNGRAFLAWCEGDQNLSPQIIRWFADPDADDDEDAGWWVNTVNLARLPVSVGHPTHWMELPEKPM